MEKITHQEEQALRAVFAIGEGTVKAIIEQMNTDLPYTTVASTIKNLEKKGWLESRLTGNAYVYRPVVSAEEFKKKFMGNVVKSYFDNSYKELVNFFVEQKKLSAKELKEIITMIEKGNQ
jgi:predicted transcriptional regulator